MNNILLEQLPDEIYKNIIQYRSSYMYDIPRWNSETNKWRRHVNVKCYVCKKDDVPLSHLCKMCLNGSGNRCCDNTLICWNCAH